MKMKNTMKLFCHLLGHQLLSLSQRTNVDDTCFCFTFGNSKFQYIILNWDGARKRKNTS